MPNSQFTAVAHPPEKVEKELLFVRSKNLVKPLQKLNKRKKGLKKRTEKRMIQYKSEPLKKGTSTQRLPHPSFRDITLTLIFWRPLGDKVVDPT